jgi:hypothetical protein
LLKNAKQLQSMLVAYPHRNRYRHNAAKDGCPECDDEIFIGFAEYYEFVACRHPALLQCTDQAD